MSPLRCSDSSRRDGIHTLTRTIGILADMGIACGFTLSIQVFGFLAGIVSLCLGVVALIAGKPYAVYYPLLLCGGLGTIVLGSLLPVLLKRYADHELRRMQAVDA